MGLETLLFHVDFPFQNFGADWLAQSLMGEGWENKEQRTKLWRILRLKVLPPQQFGAAD